jgi:hypothetical protein
VAYWIALARRCTCCLLWVLLGSQSPVSAQSARVNQPGPAAQLEEIYIGRSVRESRVAPTAFCAQARTGFSDAESEDRYTFRSTASRSSDGRIVAANRSTIGNIHACFGPTSDPAVVNFYGEGILGRVTFKGSGECSRKADWPEKGLVVRACPGAFGSRVRRFANPPVNQTSLSVFG